MNPASPVCNAVESVRLAIIQIVMILGQQSKQIIILNPESSTFVCKLLLNIVPGTRTPAYRIR